MSSEPSPLHTKLEKLGTRAKELHSPHVVPMIATSLQSTTNYENIASREAATLALLQKTLSSTMFQTHRLALNTGTRPRVANTPILASHHLYHHHYRHHCHHRHPHHQHYQQVNIIAVIIHTITIILFPTGLCIVVYTPITYNNIQS